MIVKDVYSAAKMPPMMILAQIKLHSHGSNRSKTKMTRKMISVEEFAGDNVPSYGNKNIACELLLQ